MNSRPSYLWTILLATATSTIIRAFLEFFSNPEAGGIISPWYVTLGYFLFFLSTAIGLGIIIALCTEECWQKSAARMARGLPIIFLAPILDLLFSRGQGICMAYLGTSGSRLASDLLTFFGPLGHCGITPGIRIELLLILVSIAYLIWRKTKSARKTILGTIASYAFIFIQLSVPGALGTIALVGTYAGPWLSKSFSSSILAIQPASQTYSQFGIAILMTQIHFLETCAFALAIWFHDSRETFRAWIKNARWNRSIYYFILILIGIIAAGGFVFFKSWVNGVSLVVAAVAMVSNFWLAVIINDLADMHTDSISNSDRPLQENTLDEKFYKKLGILFFMALVISSLLVNYEFFFMMMAIQLVYAAYSFRGTRWKKNFISSSLSVGANGLFAILAGFFLAQPNVPISYLPLAPILAAYLWLCILANRKDFKDRKGDAADGVKTLPVLMGTRNAALLVAALLVAWSAAIAIVFHQPYFYAMAAWFLILYLISRKVKIPENLHFALVWIAMIGVMFFVK